MDNKTVEYKLGVYLSLSTELFRTDVVNHIIPVLVTVSLAVVKILNGKLIVPVSTVRHSQNAISGP